MTSVQQELKQFAQTHSGHYNTAITALRQGYTFRPLGHAFKGDSKEKCCLGDCRSPGYSSCALYVWVGNLLQLVLAVINHGVLHPPALHFAGCCRLGPGSPCPDIRETYSPCHGCVWQAPNQTTDLTRNSHQEGNLNMGKVCHSFTV